LFPDTAFYNEDGKEGSGFARNIIKTDAASGFLQKTNND
jgi:hypothetical protein